MADDFSNLPIDETLTVRTAEEKGYRHVLDIDLNTLRDLHTDYARLIQTEGYKLGKPRYFWPEKGKDQDRGWYEPLPASQKN